MFLKYIVNFCKHRSKNPTSKYASKPLTGKPIRYAKTQPHFCDVIDSTPITATF